MERQVIDPLAEIGGLLLQLVLQLVDASAQLPDLIIELIDTHQQLRRNVATAVAVARRRARRPAEQRSAPAVGNLRLQYLHLVAQFGDLIAQRDALAALDLCWCRGGRQANRQHRDHRQQPTHQASLHHVTVSPIHPTFRCGRR